MKSTNVYEKYRPNVTFKTDIEAHLHYLEINLYDVIANSTNQHKFQQSIIFSN